MRKYPMICRSRKTSTRRYQRVQYVFSLSIATRLMAKRLKRKREKEKIT